MVIEERNIRAAHCDACGRVNYSEDGIITAGYLVTLADLGTNIEREAYACRETHIGKAARAVLAPVPAAAPALPEDGSDSTAATP